MISIFNLNKIYEIELSVEKYSYEFNSNENLKIGDIVIADTYNGQVYGKVTKIKSKKEQQYE